MPRCLDALEVEPVLTAHPTETKRRTTLHHLLRLTSRLETTDEIPEALWQTEEIRARRVTPLDEVNSVLFLVERSALAESFRHRNPYIDPLNHLQIRFLPRFRRNKEKPNLGMHLIPPRLPTP